MPKKQNNNLKLDLEFFEYIVVYNSIMDDTYLASIIDVVEPQYFKNEKIRLIFDIISKFYHKRNTSPNITEIKACLITDQQKNAFKEIVLGFKSLDSNYNKDELYENTERFFKERAVYEAVLATATKYSEEQNKINTSETLEMFEKACNISLVENLGHDYFKDIDQHVKDLSKTLDHISTGYSWLDKKLNGGFLKDGRAMYTFSGVTNVGKSIMLGNVGTNILSQDKVVIIISLEMPETIYTQRISSQLSRIPLFSLKDESKKLIDFTKKFSNQHQNARLFVKEFPPKTITTNHIRAFIKKLCVKKKIKPDAIIVDYVNLLKPTIETGNSYSDVKLVSEQLRALSYIFSCPVITATQLNRSAFDELNPGLETTSESMGLAMTTDFQASLWCDEQDKELGIIHLGIQKNRLGQNFGKIALRIDYDTLAIDEPEEEIVENTQVNDADSILSKL